MIALASLAQALGGQVDSGRGCVRAPGPGHSRLDRSLSVWLDRDDRDGFRVESFANDDWRDCRDHVRSRLGLSVQLPQRAAEPATTAAPLTDPERTRRALAMWNAAHDPRGTLVEAYLRSRGLVLPEEAAGGAIRFHPDCPFAGTRTPAMVALVRNVRTDAPQAVHRTALDRAGRKVEVNGRDRLAYGPTAGGAVKLTPDEAVTVVLGVGEGIETTLSLRAIYEYGASPVWALISAGGIERLPVLPGIEALWIAVDHDEAGTRASRSCADRWSAMGMETFLVRPRACRTDLNDTLDREVARGAI